MVTSANRFCSLRGFTLIELLVVIGIIAVLIGILLPSLNKARQSAKTLQCMSNMRSIGQAIDIYVATNKGIMPLMQERTPNVHALVVGQSYGLRGNQLAATADGNGRYWAGLLRDVAKVQVNLFVCPADSREDRVDPNEGFRIPEVGDGDINGDKNRFSYSAIYAGYNLKGASRRQSPWSITHIQNDPGQVQKDFWPWGPMPKARLKRSYEMVLLIDSYTPTLSDGSGWGKWNVSGLSKTAADQFLRKVTGFNVWLQLFRHTPNNRTNLTNAGPNALFADGHVEQKLDITRMTDDNFSYAAGN